MRGFWLAQARRVRTGSKDEIRHRAVSMRSYFFLIFVFAAISFCAANLSMMTYVFASVVIPTIVAVRARMFSKWDHEASMMLGLGAAVCTGSGLLAWGSFYQTFFNDAQGFLVGDSWSSVFSSSILGAILGFGLAVAARLC